MVNLKPDVHIIAILISIFNAILLCFVSYRSMQTLQLRGYKTEKYMHWRKNTHGRFFSRLFMLCFMSASALLVINILFTAFAEEFISYISLLVYFIYLVAFIKNEFFRKKKTPLVFTNRIKRLITLYFILAVALTYGLILLSFYLHFLGVGFLRYLFICFTPIATPILVLVAFIIMLPIENLNNKNYVVRAKHKLSKRPNLIKVGITGSYGKTSVKNILEAMLSEKYEVLSTPASYNTPMGLTKTILKQLNRSHQVFIAEMGATYRGDIKYICDFVKPDIGIITGIGNQHLESFRNEENIMNTKYELIEALSGENCFAAFNGDSSLAMELYNRCPVGKLYTKVEDDGGSFITCSNIEASEDGIRFDLEASGEKASCRTQLLGRHNVSNILLSAAVAYKMGVSLQEIAFAIGKLKPVPHRLEMIKSGGITIIDDAFNASREGTAAALEALSLFEGRRKIMVTPGMVELGQAQEEENFNFGKNIARVCDYCILVGQNQTRPIYDGLLEGGFAEDKIKVVSSIDEAKAHLSAFINEGDVILFENDLPDSYSEQ